MKIIDLRSDTVTKPSAEMRHAIASAEVGDDVFGDDPTVKKLEAYAANLFKREASLYVPSGTMGNQICLYVSTQPGWELLCERECHVVNYEASGPAALSGLLINLLPSERGMLTAEQIRQNVRPRNLHCPETRMVSLENTHNRHGGTVLPQDEVLKVREVCDEFELGFHLDGARIWNAHIAIGLSLDELTRPFDHFSVCLSKGLGAPVGSMILGSREFIERCRRVRKMFGGGMRQVGIIAAAGLYAVENNIERLAEDHANAAYLARQLDAMKQFTVDLSRVETNIIIADISDDQTVDELLNTMRSARVWAVPFGPRRIRLVTHLDVSRSDCEEAISRLKEVLK
jgi:threonine aldolase